MSKQITLTLSKYEYENRDSATILGHAYSVRNDQNQRLSKSGLSLSQFSTIDNALHVSLKRAARGYYVASITIEGTSLPESLQSFLIDKYTLETQINEITFA